ncbi:MAG TPA: hypothetical protein V6D18_10670 [Thermosynechococcaceae cyanobacterium]
MDLDAQIQGLIADAPQDGSTPALVEAIAPVLKLLAGRLRHLQYYIVQTLDQDWAITTLENREQSTLTKNVVYAFPGLKDATQGPYPVQDPQMISLPVPSAHILFQMLVVEAIDSIVFFEVPGNAEVGIEIGREELNQLIQSHLSNLQPSIESQVPPNIA